MTLFSRASRQKNEDKETATYTNLDEFQKHLHKNQLLFLSIAKFQTKLKTG